LADALSLTLLVRDDDPLRYERAAVRWLSRYTAEDRQLCLAEARELVDVLDGVGRDATELPPSGSSGSCEHAAMRQRQIA
jgi:hypothetical protein